MLSVILYSIFSVQIVYSVQLNFTDSNWRQSDRFVECITVQNPEYKDSVQCALNCSECNYRERERESYVECVTVQHI